MKQLKPIIFICLIVFSMKATAQDQLSLEEEQIFKAEEVDVKPDFPGGIDAFYKVFKKDFVAPNVPGLVDKVMLSFIVEKDGALNDIKVIHDAGFGTAGQAVKILQAYPKWLPATKDGKSVRAFHTLPIPVVTE